MSVHVIVIKQYKKFESHIFLLPFLNLEKIFFNLPLKRSCVGAADHTKKCMKLVTHWICFSEAGLKEKLMISYSYEYTFFCRKKNSSGANLIKISYIDLCIWRVFFY